MALRDRVVQPQGGKRQSAGSREDLVALYRTRLLNEIDLEEVAGLELAQQRARLERVLSRLLSLEGPVMSPRERAWLIKRVIDDAVGLGVLEPLIADHSVTEIMVNGPEDVFIERSGRIERVPTRFTSEAELYQLIDRIVSSVNRRVDESSPMVDARLPGGERVNVIIPPLALDGPTITIRRFHQPFRLPDLVARNSLPQQAADLLGALVAARFNILVSGGTGSGKTTFLNALSGMISDRERIITIEDAAELSLQQPHVVRLEARPANTEGTGQITIRDLVKNSLRMRPDRIIVGEVRGGETLDMLQAMNTGHEGSLTTVHANSAESPGDTVLHVRCHAPGRNRQRSDQRRHRHHYSAGTRLHRHETGQHHRGGDLPSPRELRDLTHDALRPFRPASSRILRVPRHFSGHGGQDSTARSAAPSRAAH